MAYFLESPRLGFRTWTEADLPFAMALWTDPDVTRFHGGAWSPQQVRARLELEQSNGADYGAQYWPMFDRTTHDAVGCCGLAPLEPGVWELGCHLRRAYWSRGLGREAAAAVIEYGVAALGARMFHAGHHPDNDASRQFLRHLGFVHTHDEFFPPTQLLEPRYRLSPQPPAHPASRD